VLAVPVLEGSVPDDALRDFGQVLTEPPAYAAAAEDPAPS
jgi:hypothetical protein